MAQAQGNCWLGLAGFLLALLLPAPNLSAYDTFGDGYGSKWDTPQLGTGAVVTWSFMTPGVGLANNPSTSTPLALRRAGEATLARLASGVAGR